MPVKKVGNDVCRSRFSRIRDREKGGKELDKWLKERERVKQLDKWLKERVREVKS